MSERLEQLLLDALQLAPEAQGPWLDALAGDDARHRDELASLLAVHRRAPGFLEQPAALGLGPAGLEPGQRVGRYEVEVLLGSGGSGSVYRAWQDEPRRAVALKVLDTGLAGADDHRRFLDEAGILARLRHPDIAHVYEAGLHEGRPYIALELIEAPATLLDHARGLPRREALALFARVCDAVHHAHLKGIVHRDLKPSNVLVQETGPKLIDFGIALEDEGGDGRVAGTLAYMSPEQLDPDADLDARADVYALGVLLHQLLSGALPLDVAGEPLPVALARLRDEPPRLAVAGDLGAIVACALARDREQRYASAAALADDVRRWLRTEPVAARPASWSHHLALFARRRTGVLVALLGLLASLVLGLVVSWDFALGERRARRQAQQQAYVASLSAASAALRALDVGEARLQLERAPAELRGWEWRHLAARLEPRGRSWSAPFPRVMGGAVSAAAGLLAVTSSDLPSALSLFEARGGEHLLDLPRDQQRPVHECAFNAAGDRLATVSISGEVDLHELPSGRRLWRVTVDGGAGSVAFAPDGSRLAVAGGGAGVRLLSSADGSLLATPDREHPAVNDLVFAPDGGRLHLALADGSVASWAPDEATWDRWPAPQPSALFSVAVSPDGALLASGAGDGSIRLRSADDGAVRADLDGHTGGVWQLAFAPDGRQLASGSLDTSVRLWDVASGTLAEGLMGHTQQVRILGFLGPGELLSFGRDDQAWLWRPGAPRALRELRGLDDLSDDLHLDDGGLTATTKDGSLARWERDGPTRVTPVRSPDRALRSELNEAGGRPVRLTHAGDRAVLAARTEGADRLRVVAVPSGEELALIGRLGHFPGTFDLTPDDRWVVVPAGPELSVWSLEDGALRRRWEASDVVLRVATHPDGERFVSAGRRGELALWTLDGARRGARTLEQGVQALCFDHAGERLAVATSDGRLELLAVPGLETLGRLVGHAAMAVDLAFSPDDRRLASASLDGTVRLWDPDWDLPLLTLRDHALYASSVAWSADGRWLASGGGGHDTEEACAVWLRGTAATSAP